MTMNFNKTILFPYSAFQMRSGFANREEILNSIRDWDSLFLRHLTDSINEVPFPDICYYCTNVRPGNPST